MYLRLSLMSRIPISLLYGILNIKKHYRHLCIKILYTPPTVIHIKYNSAVLWNFDTFLGWLDSSNQTTSTKLATRGDSGV